MRRRKRGMSRLTARQRRFNARDQRARRVGTELDGDTIAAALAFIGEVDSEHVIERRVIRMIEIDVRGVDPHPAFAALGAADERRLLDDIGAHERASRFDALCGKRRRVHKFQPNFTSLIIGWSRYLGAARSASRILFVIACSLAALISIPCKEEYLFSARAR